MFKHITNWKELLHAELECVDHISERNGPADDQHGGRGAGRLLVAGGEEAPLVRGDGDLRHVGLGAGGEDGAVREAPHVDVVTLRRHQDPARGGESRGRDLHRRH